MTRVQITNAEDHQQMRRNVLAPEQVRTIELDALVDTGATMLALPESVTRDLGLPVEGTRGCVSGNARLGRPCFLV